MATAQTIEDYKAKVNKMLTALPDEVQAINNGLALSIIPLIVKRITDLGEDGAGKKFGNYSTNALPMFFYLHKGLGSGADTALKALEVSKKKTEGKNYKGISYKEFREINNRETSFINLSFSGETLNDIGIINNISNGVLVVTTIGAQNKTSKVQYDAKGNKKGEITSEQLLDYLGERFGEDLLSLNDKEDELIGKAYDISLQKMFDKYLEQ